MSTSDISSLSIEKRIICRKCKNILNSEDHDGIRAKCPKCGRRLLPGRKLEDRIVGLVMIILSIPVSFLVAGLIRPSIIRNILALIPIGMFFGGWIYLLGIISKRERYETRADIHADKYPLQAIDDYTQALNHAKDTKEKHAILFKRGTLYEKINMLREALNDYRKLASSREMIVLVPIVGDYKKVKKEIQKDEVKKRIKTIEKQLRENKNIQG